MKINKLTASKSSKSSISIDIAHILGHYIGSNLIISDTAGMGKTTFSKYFVLELLVDHNINKIPMFLELRKIEEKKKN